MGVTAREQGPALRGMAHALGWEGRTSLGVGDPPLTLDILGLVRFTQPTWRHW